MLMGYLKLQFESDGDGTGELFATFKANGFAGHGSAWFDIINLAETAKLFAKYPLPNNPEIFLAGGYWNNDKPATLKEELLYISAYPSNARGGIGVKIRVAYEATIGDGHVSLHRATGELSTSYEQLAQFSKSLIALAYGDVKEVILDERNV